MNTHKCDPRLARCYWHPRWKVTRSRIESRGGFPLRRFPWIAWAPFYGEHGGDKAFRTHEEAVAYATEQARGDQLAAIQDGVNTAVARMSRATHPYRF